MGSELVVRRERADDHAAVRRVLGSAFADQGVVADLVDALRASTAWRPDLALVAELGDDIVGYVPTTRGWVDDPRRLVEVLVLSPLGVRADAQRRGIGDRLVRRLIELAGERPEPALFLEGSPRYYSRFGFEAAGALGFHRPSPRIPEQAFQVKRLPAYDEKLSGRLVYADPFWAMDCVGLREPSLRRS